MSLIIDRLPLFFTLVVTIAPSASPATAERPPADRFQVLVWQYKTDAVEDLALYRKAGLNGWHIDRGSGQRARAEWATSNGVPYYVDHAAGKGILHLTNQSGLGDLPKDGSPAGRPWSFFDPATMTELSRRLEANLPEVVSSPLVAIALDDEVSLGHFNTPVEVDFSDAALAAFQRWIPQQYPNSAARDRAWHRGLMSQQSRGTNSGIRYLPQTYENVRDQIKAEPPSNWRLAPWVDFRTFMDDAQADVFARLAAETNRIAPGIPVGVVGAQQPSAYGGFDYARLRNSIDFIEAYDIGGTNELLRSFWAESPAHPRMQTFFASGNLTTDQWFLRYYLAHGCQGVIAWPDIQGRPWFEDGRTHPHVIALSETFRDVQSDRFSEVLAPSTRPIFDPIAILYSHPSVQIGWAIDASVHGKTWPRRSSSLDNQCLSSGKNRVAWSRLFEDLGYQPRFIDTTELADGTLMQRDVKVLALPQAFALSQAECKAIESFVEAGGSVIADYGTAVVDNHGTGYEVSPLDRVFGIDRSSKQGWFDGSRFEINGELYQKPFVDRFAAKPASELRPVERCLGRTQLVRTHENAGTGLVSHTLFANTSPTAYYDAATRAGPFGDSWRTMVGDFLSKCGVSTLGRYTRRDGQSHGIERLRYQTADGHQLWVFVENPTRQASVDGPGTGTSLTQTDVEVEVTAPSGWKFLASEGPEASAPEASSQTVISVPPGDLEMVSLAPAQ